MAEELKACVCGSTDSSIGYESHKCYWVECGDCGYKTANESRRSLAIHTWNTRAQLHRQGGEAVEVVAWRHWGDQTRLLCDLGKQRAIPGTIADEFTVPLMEVAQHQRIMAASAPSDAFKRFAVEVMRGALEGGSFDGGDIQEMAVRHGVMIVESRSESCGENCGCAEYGFPVECYRISTHPADQVAEGVVVRRELLERLAARAAVFDDGGDGADAESARSVAAELRQLLAKSEGGKP